MSSKGKPKAKAKTQQPKPNNCMWLDYITNTRCQNTAEPNFPYCDFHLDPEGSGEYLITPAPKRTPKMIETLTKMVKRRRRTKKVSWSRDSTRLLYSYDDSGDSNNHDSNVGEIIIADQHTPNSTAAVNIENVRIHYRIVTLPTRVDDAKHNLNDDLYAFNFIKRRVLL